MIAGRRVRPQVRGLALVEDVASVQFAVELAAVRHG